MNEVPALVQLVISFVILGSSLIFLGFSYLTSKKVRLNYTQNSMYSIIQELSFYSNGINSQTLLLPVCIIKILLKSVIIIAAMKDEKLPCT